MSVINELKNYCMVNKTDRKYCPNCEYLNGVWNHKNKVTSINDREPCSNCFYSIEREKIIMKGTFIDIINQKISELKDVINLYKSNNIKMKVQIEILTQLLDDVRYYAF